MTIKYAHDRQTAAAKVKVGTSALLGMSALLIAGRYISWKAAPLVAWDFAALSYLIWTWRSVWGLDSKLTAAHALREDPSRVGSDAAVVIASLASLGALALLLAGAGASDGAATVLAILLGIISVVLAWATVHTVFALRYAEMYYREQPGGIGFPGTKEPVYKDFAYLAFTVGMTFQVSDTGFQSTEFRTVALRHSLIAYLFGTVIVATTINLIAGLTK